MHLTDDMKTLLAAHHAGETGALAGLADMMMEHDHPTHQWHGELLRRALAVGDVTTRAKLPGMSDKTHLGLRYRPEGDKSEPEQVRLRLYLHGSGYSTLADAPVTRTEVADHMDECAAASTRPRMVDAFRASAAQHRDGTHTTPLWPGHPERLSRVGGTLTSNMKARLEATRRILAEAGVRAATLPVLAHDDEVGSRPDVLVASEGHVHPALLRYLAAHHGLLHGTPNVVAFNAHENGPDRVHVIHTGVDQAAAFDTMRKAGFPKFSVHKGTVYLFDPSGGYDISPLLRPLNASKYHSIPGTGRVVGAGQGADASDQRHAYRTAIRDAEALATSAAPSAGSQGAAVARLARVSDADVKKLSRHTPESILAYGGQWKLPPESVQALYDHATGQTPLTDAEVVHHLTRNPHPVAGRIHALPVTRVTVDARGRGYHPESHQAAEALNLLRANDHITNSEYDAGFLRAHPWTKAQSPGEMFHSADATDALIHHAPSDTWMAVAVDHPYDDAGMTPEHQRQHMAAKRNLIRPILRRRLK